MLKNLSKYALTACFTSVTALTASAELVINKPMPTETQMAQHAPVVTTQKAADHKAMAKPFKAKEVATKEQTKAVKPKHTEPKHHAKKADMKMHKDMAADHHAMQHHEMVVNKPMKAESAMMAKPFTPDPKAMPVKEDKKHHHGHKHHVDKHHEDKNCNWMHDGKNFVTIKGGVAQPLKFGGTSLIDKKAGSTYVAGVALGRKFMDMMALSLEYTHRGESKVTDRVEDNYRNSRSWGVKSDTLMFNAAWDLIKNNSITPYIKGGIGASRNSTDDHVYRTSSFTRTHKGKDKTDFAWQVGMGMNFDYDDKIATELEYAYVNRGKVEADSNYTDAGSLSATGNTAKDGKLKDHVVTFGIKIKF